MQEKITNSTLFAYICLILGTLFYTFVGWHWNMPVAAWISPLLLVCFVRKQQQWIKTLIMLPGLSLVTFLKMRNGWEMDLYLVILFSVLLPIILIYFPAICDWLVWKKSAKLKLPLAIKTLIFPTLLLVAEFIFNLTPMGTGFSLGATQFHHEVILQLASITGIWGISFFIAWTASITNAVFDKSIDLTNPPKITKIYAVILLSIFSFGAFRVALGDPSADTVKVASISVTHTQDYWAEIVDNHTPVEGSESFKVEFEEIEENLYNLSEQAVKGGANIVFWSEGNAIFYEDQESTFLNRARSFAIDHQIYFVPGVLKLYYGSEISDNMAYMITPDGEVVFEYIKTISWYETNADGIIKSFDTPYGRLAIAICFDNDFPNFIRQAGKQQVDILLVPAFDTEVIKDYHTKSSVIRGVENGMSVIRHSNKGVSMGVDYHGHILAYQDYFDTNIRIMYTDIPTKGTWTVYSVLGDWIIYTDFVFIIGFSIWLLTKILKKRYFR